MDKFLWLAENSLQYYLKNKKYPYEYDEVFENNHNGIMVEIFYEDKLRGRSGSIFPTKKNAAYDIIYNSIEAGFFSKRFNPINDVTIGDHKVIVYEFYDVINIRDKSEFGDYDGIEINFMQRSFLGLMKDYKDSDELFDEMLKKYDIDSREIYSISKFKLRIHE